MSDHPINTEQYYTVEQIAKAMQVSYNTAKKWFQHEPGVIAFGSHETIRKRQRITLRIPESVFLSVKQRMTIQARSVNVL